MEVFPYLFVEDQNDLTLVDPSFLSQLPKIENYLLDIGYNIKNVKRIILTHVHVDHSRASNEVRRKSGAKIYSHCIEVRYPGQNPPYRGPPSAQETVEKLEKIGVSMEGINKRIWKFRCRTYHG